jgi:hypothetical protein
MSFDDELAEMGFELVQQTRDGTRRYARRSHAFLQWWVLARPDATAELTWEFELGAYLKAKGFAFSVQDELSLLLFPLTDVRGPADASWVTAEIERAETHLASLDLRSGV